MDVEADTTRTSSSDRLRSEETEETLCCGVVEKDESDPDFGCLLGPGSLSFLIVVCGTASTITSKLMFETRSHGTDACLRHDDDSLDDDEHWHNCKFTKPWFQTLVMKVAMSTCYLLSRFTQWYRSSPSRQKDHLLGEALLTPPDSPTTTKPQHKTPTSRAIRMIAYPAMTDLVQTVLSQAGLLWVTSSTYQMMRGSVIIFTCFLSIRYMGKKMTRIHWASTGVVCVAVAVVGVAGLLGEEDEGGGGNLGTYLLGISLIILGQIVGAAQFVLEEYLMIEMDVTPTLLVGWEGIWGTLYFVVLAPILTVTPASGGAAATIWHEDFVDTFVQLKNSKALLWLTFASSVALLVYNLVGNMVTKQLSAILRSILESCRTLGVWMTGIVLWYAFDNHSSGEEWTVFSYLELLGFALLVYGTVAYRELLPIPGCTTRPTPPFSPASLQEEKEQA